MSEKQTLPEDIVKLKPIMGIRPGVYLSVLYSIILLVILFFLLVFPGITNPGVVIDLKTEPDGAAIRVNGIYMGTSGNNKERIFVPKGTQTLEAVLPGFESQTVILEIPGRLFGSLFFPLRYPIEFTLKTSDPQGVFAEAAADFSAWTFGGEPTAAWQIPLSLSEGAYRIGPQRDPFTYEILAAASRFTVTRAALRDIVRAKMLLDNSGLSPSPASIAGSVSDILAFLSENTGSAQWLADLLPQESASIVRNSDWYQNETARTAVSSQVTETRGMQNTAQISVYGITFSQLGEVYIANPVPRTLFETFLREEETQRQREDLAEIFSLIVPEREYITGVSRYDAEAFCRWLTAQLTASMADMEVRLPTEAEWERIAQTGIMPSLWEWCADPFAPLTFINASQKAANAVGSQEFVIRQQNYQRSSLPPDLSSPFLTFRPVIAPKR